MAKATSAALHAERPRLAMNVVPVFTHLAGLFMLTLEAV